MCELLRQKYLNDIRYRLAVLSTNVKLGEKNNLLDTNVYSETLFAGLLDLLFGWNLSNANSSKQNAEGIDLIDHCAKVIVQVTGTCTKKKIEHSLSELGEKYKGFHFYFLPIVEQADYQKKQDYTTPENITFNPKDDIIDMTAILKLLNFEKSIDKIKAIHDFVLKNINSADSTSENLDSGVEYVISKLAIDDTDDEDFDFSDFELEAKISFNNLDYGKSVIKEYAPQYRKVSQIYEVYSSMGKNKSKAVLQKLRKIYLELKQNYQGDSLFKEIEKQVMSLVSIEAMPEGTTSELLEMCVDTVIVHAFMECKIFEKPKD